MPIWQTTRDFYGDAEAIRQARYGVIDVRQGRLAAVHLRPWPKGPSLAAACGLAEWWHRRAAGDVCRLYYNQPRRFPQFLALKYVASARATSLRTFRGTLLVLDEIARLKGCDALLADVLNLRISGRLLGRWGWEPHRPSRWHRHYIKRFYGRYPADAGLQSLLAIPLESDLSGSVTAATIPPPRPLAARAKRPALGGR